MDSRWLILGFIGLYFAAVLWAAKCFNRKIQGLHDFFLAGQTLGQWPVALTFAATWFGAASTIGTLNAVNQKGLIGLWELVIPSALSFIVITLFFARQVAQFSRNGMLSQPQAIESAYGSTGRLILSLTILLAATTFMGSQLVAAGQVFQAVLGIDYPITVMGVSAVVVAYALMGGYYAVVVTDMLQMAMIYLGLFTLLVFCLSQSLPLDTLQGNTFFNPSYWSTWFSSFQNHRPANFWNLTPSFHYLFLTLTFVLGWSIAPEMWQRMSSLKDPKKALRTSLLATVLISGLFLLVVSTAIFSVLMVPYSQNVLVDLAFTLPFPLLTALVLSAVISAIGSTLDSSINVASLTFTQDLYHRFFRPTATSPELLLVSRMSTVAVIIPGVALAIAFQDIIRVLWISADIYTSMMFFPIWGILYVKRPTALSGILAMSLGGLSVLISALNQYEVITLSFWPEWPYSTALGVALSGIGFFIGHHWRKAEPKTGKLLSSQNVLN